MIDEIGENEHTGALAVYIIITALAIAWSAMCGSLYYVINNLR